MQKNILILDDDRIFRRRYSKELEKAGFRVLTATGANQAIDLIQDHKIHVMILELGFSNGSGIESLNEIIDLDQDLKVIIYTEYPEYKYDLRTWVADAFLVKSPDLTRLIDTVRALVVPDCRERDS